MLSISHRPRRNRSTPAIRELVKETRLHPSNFIQPLFITEGEVDEDIPSMPGCRRWSLPGLLAEAGRVSAAGVPAVVVFPRIADALKTRDARASYDPEGLVPRAVRALKRAHPSLCVITDVALDPYNSDGHDGLVSDTGEILNDPTVAVLVRQAMCHAAAGADMVSPSDMMDGRVAAIRAGLDGQGFQQTGILSYTAKYASACYGPFRGALDSAPRAGDKKTYQMDPANIKDALREAALDEAEGADMLMVKPAGYYLDVIRAVSQQSMLPIAAYQVSGEYLMIKSAAATGWLEEKALVMESLTAIRRAGASSILTYYARQAAEWLNE